MFVLAACDTPRESDSDSFRAGLATDVRGLSDRSSNDLAKQGLDAVGADRGFVPDIRESEFEAGYLPNIERLIQGGSTGIVTVGIDMIEATGEMAAGNPDVNFAIVDASVTGKAIARAPNVRGLLFRQQEAGYLAGYLAAKVAEAENPNTRIVIGAVGGLPIRSVEQYLAGYVAGAKAAVPDIAVLVSHSHDADRQQPCRELSLAHIERGSLVEFHVAGRCGLGTLSVAREKGIWAVGTDADQAYLGDHILTSAMKRVDVAVERTVRAMAEGTFEGGADTVFDLKSDGVALGVISPKVPQEIIDQVQAVRSDIMDGTITVPESREVLIR